jgi:MFS transporter, DHA1 family, tetracycline resistance protein
MTEVPATQPEPSRAAVSFILVTVALDVLSLGLIIPVFPTLIEQLAGGDAAYGAKVFGLFGTMWALMQFIFQPVLGGLSDRYGRRPVVLLSNLGLGLDYILMALAPSLALLFIGRAISGICASSFSTATAYIADVTAPEKRAAAFGKIGAAFGLGFVLGPAIGGLLGSADPRLPFWVAAAFSLANAAYGYFVLPESLPKERRSAFTLKKANPIGSLQLLASSAELTGLALVNFIYQLAHAVLPAVFVLYAGYRYQWDARAVGLALAAVGVCSAIVQGGLIKPVVARFGERRTLIAGLLFGAVGMSLYGLAPTGQLVMLTIPIMAMWGLANPAAQGLMTRLVKPAEQGQLQGANASLTAIASLIGPGLYTQTFAHFIASGRDWVLPGAPFLLAGGLLALAAVMAARVTREPQAAAASKPL